MDLDDLFKKPTLPQGKKRKLPERPTAEQLEEFKRENLVPHRNGLDASSGKRHRVTVSDEGADNGPAHDGDEALDNDDERFYGSGLTSEQTRILNLMDGPVRTSADGDEIVDEESFEDVIDLVAIRRQLLTFERAITTNQDQRSKYFDQPALFIDSEADLDSALRSLLALTIHPSTFYPELCRLGTVESIVGLLSHENEDISVATLEVLDELTDEEVGNEESEVQDVEAVTVNPGLQLLVETLVKDQAIELIVQNMARLKEEDETGQNGIFHSLSLIENIVGIIPKLAFEVLEAAKLLSWLLKRIERKDLVQNRFYSAEILAILMQNLEGEGLQQVLTDFARLDGIEICLQVLAVYRDQDPQSPEEVEFMENVFDILCTVISTAKNKDLFLEAEGLELVVIMMKERKMAKMRSIKLLDHLVSEPNGAIMSERFVSAAGLKYLFGAFVGKSARDFNRKYKISQSEVDDHLLNIFASWFTTLPSNSESRIRVQAKFVERSYEKTDRLLECRELAEQRLKATEESIAESRKTLLDDGVQVGEAEEDEFYLRGLDGGRFTLQLVDYVLAWIVMEDDGAREHVISMLARKGQSVEDMIKVLQIYRDDLGQSNESARVNLRDIIDHLVEFLMESSQNVQLV